MSPNLNHAAKTAEGPVEIAHHGGFFTASSAQVDRHPF
jgi:hypothetical protein